MRSASFRQGPLSPSIGPGEGAAGENTAPEVYRKQVARIEDLEKENKRLAKEATESEKRWQKAEEELADLREAEEEGEGKEGGEVEKLKSEITALQRQNSQLQSAATRRHGSSPSISMSSPPPAVLQSQLDSKSATIETMELEISRLRAAAERQQAASSEKGESEASALREQIEALEQKLSRAEQSGEKAQRELADLKREVERASERAVKEGSARTSAETQARTLEREAETLRADKAELEKKAEALDKKVAALGTLHKENEGRQQGLRREKETAEKEAREAQNRIETLEAENARLRKKDAAEGGGDDEGLDELEDEERKRMEKKIRDLEGEVYDLRRGIWHQRRKEMEVGGEGGEDSVMSPGGGFTNVDLGGGGPMSPSEGRHGGQQRGGFGDFFASGLNALTGDNQVGGAGGANDDDDGFLPDDDDDDFDEDAFRRAHEEEQKARLDRVKEVKRGLKNWEGWRLDLVEGRHGGHSEVFDI